MPHHFHAFALLFFGALSCNIWTQSPSMVVSGTVRDFSTDDSISFTSVQIQEVQSDATPTPIKVSAGRYEVELTEEKPYRIIYTALGKVAKSVLIDTRGPTPRQWEGGHGINIDVTLLDSLPGIDYSVLSEPFGKAHWSISSSSFEWDLNYTKALNTRQKKLLRDYEAARKKQN